jgi:hypothetical protein
MELAQTMVAWLEVQENSCLEATLCEEFSSLHHSTRTPTDKLVGKVTYANKK